MTRDEAAVPEWVSAWLPASWPGSAVSVVVSGPEGRRAWIGGTLAHDDPTPLTSEHVFDLASLTKPFVAVAALRLAERGLLDLDAPVAEHLAVGRSGGGADGSRRITARHLLTHTAGLPPVSALWRDGLAADALLEGVLATPLVAPPGERHDYSCLGFIALGRLLEIVDGTTLDVLVIREVLDPLGAVRARFGPVAASSAVATEIQPHRGLVRGEVHDELAHALGRPVGNAGLFGTVDDVAALGEMIARGGDGRVARVLGGESLRALVTAIPRPAEMDAAYGQTVGLRRADPGFMGAIDGAGHTGFTGTSLVVEPDSGRVAVLLTNRVHPTREGADIAPIRQAFARAALGPDVGRAG